METERKRSPHGTHGVPRTHSVLQTDPEYFCKAGLKPEAALQPDWNCFSKGCEAEWYSGQPGLKEPVKVQDLAFHRSNKINLT